MSIENRSGAVLMLPFKSGTIDSLDHFYHEIGWNVVEEDARQFLTTAIAPIEGGNGPSITYWHTHIFDRPNGEDEEEQRIYTPELQRLVEVSLVVPTNRDVERLLRLGGRLLQKNIYEFPDRNSGSLSFRFTDPFNYHLGIRSSNRTEDILEAPDSVYVTTFTKWETDTTVPIVSPDNFVAFAINSGSSSLIARKAFRSIVTAAARDPEGFDEFIERSEGKIVGLNPIKIRDLIALIEESKNNPNAPHYIDNFGPRSLSLLDKLYAELFPEA